MASSRFQRLISHLQRQEDTVRAELVEADRSIQAVHKDLDTLAEELRGAAKLDAIALRDQFLLFSAVCGDRELVYRHQLQALQARREQIQSRLLSLWRRRRSLETLEQRQQQQRATRQERRANGDILDGAVRAWYLQEQANEDSSESASVVETHSEVIL